MTEFLYDEANDLNKAIKAEHIRGKVSEITACGLFACALAEISVPHILADVTHTTIGISPMIGVAITGVTGLVLGCDFVRSAGREARMKRWEAAMPRFV